MLSILPKPIQLKISDDSGFIAIVNADKYNSFVHENWELEQLFNRFTEEMNKDNLIIWSTGSEKKYSVQFNNHPTAQKSFREFSKTITVTAGQLFLVSYDDLTMAAQFADEKIPAKHNADIFIKLDNGKYTITVRQMFDPEHDDYDPNGKPDFEVIIQAKTITPDLCVEKI